MPYCHRRPLRLAPRAVVRKIVNSRDRGDSFDAIAGALTAEGVLSPEGCPRWQPSTVRRIYRSATTEPVESQVS
ncbi:recombinase family protein [Mycobacterium sp. GA-2829]|uniref:recombinase family protein n=1 Tax=Mycobacterium sp. GA-2829 TaxID=1772283 RepID=UPI0009E962E8